MKRKRFKLTSEGIKRMSLLQLEWYRVPGLGTGETERSANVFGRCLAWPVAVPVLIVTVLAVDTFESEDW